MATHSAGEPSTQQLQDIAAKLNLQISQDKIQEYQEAVNALLEPLADIRDLPEQKPPVKHARVPGYRPSEEENPHNAWYWKTDIVGASEGKLKGKKIAMKDNISIAGVPMMTGSRLLEGHVPDYDAPVVTKVLDEGGHIVGKAVCEDMCYSGGSFTSVTGPVPHPLDKTRMVGGSSSGCGVLVAVGEVDMAVGGDQGGSIRIPASWLGIVGLKPTFGLVSYTGAVSWEPTLDHLGPMTRTVHDCALMLEVLAGSDGGFDARQPANIQVPQYTKCLSKDLSGLRVGLIQEGFDICQEQDQDVVRSAAAKLEPLGAKVENCSFPTHNLANNVIAVVDLVGASHNVLDNGGVSLGQKCFYDTRMNVHLQRVLKSHPGNMSRDCVAMALASEFVKDTYGNQFYCKAANIRRKVTKDYNELLEKYDVIIMPTLPYVAPKFPPKESTVKELMDAGLGMVGNTAVFDLTGHPALSINAGHASHDNKDLPVGMMIVGRHFDEATVLKVAYAFEQTVKQK